ncbi:transcription antitermination factor NusB [Dermacoccaceae bacterium W4C1]
MSDTSSTTGGPTREPGRAGARSKARRHAQDILFEAEQRSMNAVDLLEARRATATDQNPVRPYTDDVVRGVVGHWHPINEALTAYSRGWTLERMPAVDRAILRVGAYEVLYNDEVPDAVAVSEAVASATQLSTDDSPSFVNGLLSRLSEVKQTLV